MTQHQNVHEEGNQKTAVRKSLNQRLVSTFKIETMLKVIISIFLVIATAIVTNPDVRTHQDAVKQEFTRFYEQEYSSHTQYASTEIVRSEYLLSKSFGMSVIDNMVDFSINCSNYGLFSLTKMSWDGNEQVIGVGLFGTVFLLGDFKNSMGKLSLSML